MKRFFLLATLLLVVTLSVTFQLHSRRDYMGDLLLENIEALAYTEMPQGGCVGYGSVDCPINHAKVYFVTSGYSLEGFN